MSKGFLRNVKFVFATTLTCLCSIIHSQPVLSYDPFISGLSLPVDIVNAGDNSNRLFIVQQRGVIRVHNGTSLLTTPFLDVTSLLSTGSEQGLLSLVFHPNYENPLSRYFFIYYTNLAGDITIARYQPSADPNVANPAGVVLLTIPKPFANHNGGKLNFGTDGYLYFGTGDGGSGDDPGNNAQNGNSLLGKMLRINVNNFALSTYEIPPDNPYVGAGDGMRDEIWAMGLRNPWRWSFDSQTGAMFIGDVGQGLWEEVDYRAAPNTGAVNYGWRCYEGNHVNTNVPACTPSGTYVPPIYEYGHNAQGGQSIVGGIVYRGTNPTNVGMVGYYIFDDTYSNNSWVMNTNVVGFPTTRQTGLPAGISGFGVDETGELYVASLFSNIVYRVNVSGALPVQLVSFTGKSYNGFNELKWKTAMEQDLQRFMVEYSLNGSDYVPAGEVTPANDPNGHEYTYRHFISSLRKLFYRIRIVERDGSEKYSSVISLNEEADKQVRLYPTIVVDRALQIVSQRSVTSVSVYNSSGSLVHRKDMKQLQGHFQLDLPAMSAGVYWLRLQGGDWNDVQKFIVR